MRARADYPTSPQFRRGIDRPSTKHGIAAREMREHRPSRQALPNAVPSKLASSQAVELATMEAAHAIARNAFLSLADLLNLMKERPDLFNSEWVPGTALKIAAFMAKAKAAIKKRGGRCEGKGP